MDKKVEFLKDKVLVEQNDVAVLLGENRFVTFTVLKNGKPTSVRVSAKCVYDLLSSIEAKQ
jgi:hypothetical protein